MSATVFITGGTGLVGADVIRRLLHNTDVKGILALVRGANVAAAAGRLRQAVRILDPSAVRPAHWSKVEVVTGDVTAANFGWSDGEWSDRAERVTHVIHSAADVRFDLPLEEARRSNLGGTRNALAFACEALRRGGLQRYAHVSTAFVCGDRQGVILEDDNAVPTFTNSYEQSKWESEQLVRSAMADLPTTIFRPSIIVGDAGTGRTNAFKALYIPLRMITRNILTSLPGAEGTSLDVVPVDYVSGAICHVALSKGKGIGQVLHLTAGEARSCSAEEIVSLTREVMQNMGTHAAPTLRMVDAAQFQADEKKESFMRVIAGKLACFAPYLSIRRDFEDSNTRLALRGSGLVAPDVRSYFSTVIMYCLETRWGKRVPVAA